MTRRHSLYKRLKGTVCHVTGTDGLRGILRRGNILPNVDGSLGYRHRKGKVGCYVCQNRQSISLVDFKNSDETRLFDFELGQHWVGIFREHAPTIVLIVSGCFDLSRAERFTPEQVAKIGGLYIAEAEICFPAMIPVSSISGAMVLDRELACIFASGNLPEILSFCDRNIHRFRPRRTALEF